jgi:hypothetical protein
MGILLFILAGILVSYVIWGSDMSIADKPAVLTGCGPIFILCLAIILVFVGYLLL